jgi:hypothetical protein
VAAGADEAGAHGGWDPQLRGALLLQIEVETQTVRCLLSPTLAGADQSVCATGRSCMPGITTNSYGKEVCYLILTAPTVMELIKVPF